MVKTTPRPLYHGKRHTVPAVREAVWDIGPEWKNVEKKNLGLTAIQTPNGPVGSVSLYPLRYPGSIHVTLNLKDIEWNGAARTGKSSGLF
jgi:hypothetical protein